MTRKQMITAIVDDQIKRGIVKAEDKDFQIKVRINGLGAMRPMGYQDCVKAYEDYFAN